jgi:hypothetical protein
MRRGQGPEQVGCSGPLALLQGGVPSAQSAIVQTRDGNDDNHNKLRSSPSPNRGASRV